MFRDLWFVGSALEENIINKIRKIQQKSVIL